MSDVENLEIYGKLYEEKLGPLKAKMYLDYGMKRDLIGIREDIAGHYSWRTKTQALDIKKVPAKIVLAAINKVHNIKNKESIETEFDLYEKFVKLIEDKKISTELIEAFVGKNKSLSEVAKEKRVVNKNSAEAVQNGEILKNEEKALDVVVKLMLEKLKKEEEKKFNKDCGITKKEHSRSGEEIIEAEKVEEIIKILELEEEIKIK